MTAANLPEAISDNEAFQAGYVYGEGAADNDLAWLNGDVSVLRKLIAGIRPTDWFAGVLAGYQARRGYEREAN